MKNESIDYKEQVKRFHHDAIESWHVTGGQLCGWVIKDSPLSFGEIISELASSRKQAWQSAYNKLNKTA